MNREQFMQNLGDNCDQALQLVSKKNQDYADGQDPFQNFRMVENTGLCSVEEGIAVRMTDKMQRIINLLNEDAAVEDEKMEDTLLDLMNYANIMLTYRQNQGKQEGEAIASIK